MFTMKLHPFMWLFCYAICLATACKKQEDLAANNADAATLLKQQPPDQQEFRAANFSFVKKIDNPYLPLQPGTVFHYVNTIIEDGETSLEHIRVTVTSDIKKILGVNCVVVHDQVKEGGEVTEDTYDWYAQDI